MMAKALQWRRSIKKFYSSSARLNVSNGYYATSACVSRVDCKFKFNNANPVAPIHRFQLMSIGPLRPVKRSENVFGLHLFDQFTHHSALELGLGYAMTRVKVNNCVIMVGKEPPRAHHFDLVRFHLKSYNSHKRIEVGKSAMRHHLGGTAPGVPPTPAPCESGGGISPQNWLTKEEPI